MAAFAPEIITRLGPLPITNTFLHTLIVDGLLLGIAFSLSKKIKKNPEGLQVIVEPIIDGLYNLTESIALTKKKTQAIFPWVATFFIFIFVSNFTGLLPGVGTFGFFPKKTIQQNNDTTKQQYGEQKLEQESEEHTMDKTKEEQAMSVEKKEHDAEFVPLLRGATSDINVTLALATISVVATHVLSIMLTGFKDYINRWLSFNPINLYVGLLEFVAEFTKIISLSFRLFGNIFAGEVALHTISSLFAFLAPLPFLLLESIVSVVQALVFSILTLVFMSVLTTSHHAHEHSESN